MLSLKEIRDRISSIESIMKITSAMKMVSASKLKKAQRELIAIENYWKKLKSISSNLENVRLLSKKTEAIKKTIKRPTLILLIGSNKGLCGGFNNGIPKAIGQWEKAHPNETFSLLTIGKKIKMLLNKDYAIYQDRSDLLENPTLEASCELIKTLLSHSFDRVIMIYNYPKRLSVNEIHIKDLISNEFHYDRHEVEFLNDMTHFDFIIEPSKKEVLTYVELHQMEIKLFKAIMQSLVAEHGSRMMAMHQANENASSLKTDLSLSYNKARQASITKEIIELSSSSIN